MTVSKDFKKSVRARMEATGETYTEARDFLRNQSSKINDQPKWNNFVRYFLRCYLEEPVHKYKLPAMEPVSPALISRIISELSSAGVDFSEFPKELDVDYAALNTDSDFKDISTRSDYGPLVFEIFSITALRHDYYVHLMEDHGIYESHKSNDKIITELISCLLYTSPSPRDRG